MLSESITMSHNSMTDVCSLIISFKRLKEFLLWVRITTFSSAAMSSPHSPPPGKDYLHSYNVIIHPVFSPLPTSSLWKPAGSDNACEARLLIPSREGDSNLKAARRDTF